MGDRSQRPRADASDDKNNVSELVNVWHTTKNNKFILGFIITIESLHSRGERQLYYEAIAVEYGHRGGCRYLWRELKHEIQGRREGGLQPQLT